MDDIERAAIAAEGYDPHDPAVVAALARVSAVLADLGRQQTLVGPNSHHTALTRALRWRAMGLHRLAGIPIGRYPDAGCDE